MRTCPSCSAELKDETTFCTTCGLRQEALASSAASADVGLGPGRVVDGKYRIERVLGEGGMGVVYLARAIHTDTEVVIKAVRPEIAYRKDIRERTLAEGKALARIDHPNVVQLKSVVVGDDELLLVMQYIEGENLEDRILRFAASARAMPFADVLRLFRQVLAGVGAAHAEGVIHRDLKPANVLIRKKDGVAKVTDFGIAKPEDESQDRSQTKGIIGSVHYMSPEQVRGQRDVDRRADIYALGVVLFQMLTGRVPFDGDNTYDIMRQQIDAPLPSVTPGRSDLPPSLDGILQKACAKEREHRFDSCEAFLQALAAIDMAPTGTDLARLAAGPTIPAEPALPTMDMPGPLPPTAADSVALPPGPGGASRAGALRHPSTITGQAAELPAASGGGGRGWLWAVLSLVVLASAGTALVMAGVVPLGGPARETQPEPPPPPPPTVSEPQTTSSESPPADPLDQLAGTWVAESGRELNAVRIGDRVEFQVVEPSQFAPQDYRAREARFVLRVAPEGAGHYLVEDRVRPAPPTGYTFTTNARLTCLGLWREASDGPLRAELHGDRLDVDFAKIEPQPETFQVAGKTVASCRGLEALPAARIPSVFRRP